MYIINKETNRIEKIESTTFKQLGFTFWLLTNTVLIVFNSTNSCLI